VLSFRQRHYELTKCENQNHFVIADWVNPLAQPGEEQEPAGLQTLPIDVRERWVGPTNLPGRAGGTGETPTA
jgi:hypothetical protein